MSEVEEEVCPICLDPDRSIKWCTTVCGHHFHVHCADKISKSHHKCPMCRADLAFVKTEEETVSCLLGDNIPSDSYFDDGEDHSMMHIMSDYYNTAINFGSSAGISTYSFGLQPGNHQPSGSVNFSRIDSGMLRFEHSGYPNMMRVRAGMMGSFYTN